MSQGRHDPACLAATRACMPLWFVRFADWITSHHPLELEIGLCMAALVFASLVERICE